MEGIVNGMDLEEWDPSTDKYLALPYDEANVFEGKAAAKAQLQAELGLEVNPDVPLFGYIGRLEEQKGARGGGGERRGPEPRRCGRGECWRSRIRRGVWASLWRQPHSLALIVPPLPPPRRGHPA